MYYIYYNFSILTYKERLHKKYKERKRIVGDLVTKKRKINKKFEL